MRLLTISILLFFWTTIHGEAQPYNFPPLKGYRIVSNYPVFTPDDLWDFINGAADGYLSYGFENVYVREYVKGKGKIKVEIYRHKDRDNTFGIYASERSPSFRYVRLGAQGYVTDGSVNFFKDCYYVKLRTYSSREKVVKDMETLALRLADMLPGDAAMPETLTEFPDNSREKYSETYINESVLGHEFLSGAYRAEYNRNGTHFQVYIIKRNTPVEAAQMVKAYLSVTKIETNDLSEGKYLLNDGYNGNIFLAWKGTRVVIITGLAKDQSDLAYSLTGEILK